ncbi:MAG: glutamate--tRNA ligase [Candidatus Aenigmarchaeota archaeon]|nr:glutamate--tRNA ligase [Candidatus Aenigmarchaeota archaeon]
MDIRTLALQNAVQHGGQASVSAVLGRVLAAHPELRADLAAARAQVEAVVAEVNTLPAETQREQAGTLPERQTREGLPPLPEAIEGKVVTRFAPAPTGAIHLLHALRAIFISSLYAEQYHGSFLLRFEDTDPRKVVKEFYGMIREDIQSLGVKVAKEDLESAHMDLYYQATEQLLQGGQAYVCSCTAQAFQAKKKAKEDCPCRYQATDRNVLGWKGMLSGRYREGEMVVRFRTSMQDPNPAMRDPAILRIVDAPHPLTGDRYRVWPLYNLANVVMDSRSGVTHVFRGKEHEHNTAIQEKLYRALGLQPPVTVNFGMLYLPGEKMHKRDIRTGMAEGRYQGWDDINLPTIRAFLRRGFQAEAIRQFSLSCGLSKTDIRIDLANLEALNRRLIDPRAGRYMVVPDPVAIDVSLILQLTGLGKAVQGKAHPDREELREIPVSGTLLVSREDFTRFRGKPVRLMDLFNVVLDEQPVLDKRQEFDLKTPKIQWVAEKPHVPITILMPGQTVQAVGERALGSVRPGEIVQMIRVGFGRVDRPGVIAFAHK